MVFPISWSVAKDLPVPPAAAAMGRPPLCPTRCFAGKRKLGMTWNLLDTYGNYYGWLVEIIVEILEIIMDIIIMDIMYWNYVLELYMEIIYGNY
jgi:hypothetical protein